MDLELSKKQLTEIVKACESWNELTSFLEVSKKDVSKLQAHIQSLGIKTQHFKAAWNLGLTAGQHDSIKSVSDKTRISDDVIFIQNSTYTSNEGIKQRLLEKGWLYRCSGCGNSGEWKGKSLGLQLDHKNGNRRDHRYTNLRFLCPNCHSQTDTFCLGVRAKSDKKRSLPKHNKFVCRWCQHDKESQPHICASCGKRSSLKVLRPDKQTLIDQITCKGYPATANIYGVIPNTLRQWLRDFGIDPKTVRKISHDTDDSNQ